MAESEKRIALLIDADNAPASKIDAILNEVARHGVVNVRRAYGNWKSQSLAGWEKVLHEYAIRPIQQFAYSPGKNASDMAMVIDAMDLMFARTLDGFAVVSSDADFTPLVMRLRNDGYAVYGFGQKQTPLPFVKACSTFLYLEKLGDDGDVADDQVRPQTSGELKGDAGLAHQLRGAVAAVADDEGWAHLGGVGSHLNNQGSFDPRNYGYRSLSALIEAVDLFEVRREGQKVLVRERPHADARRRRRPGKAAPAKAAPGATGAQ
ncbi:MULTISPECIES: NYN domain-containing protein [unclassified Luteimonas]